MRPISEVYNMDCMDYMLTIPDKFFDLAIVDPPFGIGEEWRKRKSGRRYKKTSYGNNEIPGVGYFKELFRISKNQIIWGYNYYTNILGPTNHIIVWDKCASEKTSFYSMCEFAYNSFRTPARIMRIPWDGARRGKETGITKIHPHQKPLELYRMLLTDYANPGDKIFDSHLGSGSHRIVAYKLGLDFYATEIDNAHYNDQEYRFREECFGEIVQSGRLLVQKSLFV